MPYRSNEDLPDAIRRHLPAHAQSIFREAFNHAWETYQAKADREGIARRVAWAAVKRSYEKIGRDWAPKA
jgi:cation transport regulator